MLQKDFDEILTDRLIAIKNILGSKAKEYATEGEGGDRLHNFKVAARIAGTSPERALMGMAMKHLVSVMDLVDASDQENPSSLYMINEKCGDLINYMILLEALLKERRKDFIFGEVALRIEGPEKNSEVLAAEVIKEYRLA